MVDGRFNTSTDDSVFKPYAGIASGPFITSRQVKNADVLIKFSSQSRSSNRRLITGSLHQQHGPDTD